MCLLSVWTRNCVSQKFQGEKLADCDAAFVNLGRHRDTSLEASKTEYAPSILRAKPFVGFHNSYGTFSRSCHGRLSKAPLVSSRFRARDRISFYGTSPWRHSTVADMHYWPRERSCESLSSGPHARCRSVKEVDKLVDGTRLHLRHSPTTTSALSSAPMHWILRDTA